MEEWDDGNTKSAYVIEEIDYTLTTQFKDGFGHFQEQLETVQLWALAALAQLLGGRGLI